jgi:hypothetical protein
MALPFVGPSAALANRKADIQRTINMHLVAMETPGKAPWLLESTPGLIERWSLGSEIRGAIEVGSRAFVVAGSTLYELLSDYTSAEMGTLATATGPVRMAYGLSQLGIVDGTNMYCLTLATDVFAQVTDEDFEGSKTIDFLDNYFTLIQLDSQIAQITAIDDLTSIDALDFASAESAPDNLVAQAVLNERWLQFGELTTETHRNFAQAGADYPFERSQGSTIEVGCAAVYSVQKVDSSVFWIGRDGNGSGMVYRFVGGQAQRISTTAVEQALQASTAIADATSYAYQQDGKTFYAINAPGLASTWVYEVASSSWHERCDLDEIGQFKQHRARVHLHAFGLHLVGDEDGYIYQLDRNTYTNSGQPLVRERISPHEAVAGRVRQFFSAFFLDATTGEAPQGVSPEVELSWSDDSGATWSNPVMRSLGAVGQRIARVLWTRLGSARDRVWKVRFSGNAPFNIVDARADSTKGTS